MHITVIFLLSACTSDKPQDSLEDTAETLTFIPAECPDDTEHAVMSTHGCILGKASEGQEHFLNIPYAQPPVGELRWKRPLPATAWEEPLNADRIGDFCVQAGTIGLDGDEDCLNLNIIRPDNTTSDSNLPILFFTHGGSYTSGAGSMETYVNNPQLANESIIVTHNYRLNAFGFLAHSALSTEDATEHTQGGSSGNQGLFDTLMALQWIVDNAESFGGDPEQLMIFGESAGGMSTCALLASPLAEGLFSSALIQSAGCLWLNQPLSESTIFSESAEEQGNRLANALNCEGSDEEILSCMREASDTEVFNALSEETGFQPNVDGIFLPDAAGTLFFEGNFNRVPIIAGITGNEGSMFVHSMGLTTQEGLTTTLNEWAPYWGITDTSTLQTLYNVELYGDAQEAFDQFYSDVMFVCPTKFFLDSVSIYVDSHAYYYTHVPSWIQYYPTLTGWGAYHSSELPFVFGTFLSDLLEEEQNLSSYMQSAWISLATNAPSVETVGEWPLYNSTSVDGGSWIDWNATAPETVIGVRQQQCDFLSAQWFSQ